MFHSKHFIKKNTLTTLYLLLCILGIQTDIYGRNYYVDPSSTSNISNGSFNEPWKTMSQVNTGTLNLLPGDSVLFKRGQILSGRLIINASGTSLSPIVYSAYGIGLKPELTYSASDIITIANKQYVVIDGLKIIDKTMPVEDHTMLAKISYAITLNNAPNCTIKNCEITLVGIAIAVQAGSNNTTIDSNYIHNLRAVRNTVGGDDDYGANAMVIGSSFNSIKHNKMVACWATSYDYGYDGGAIEYFGSNVNDNLILYNEAIDCNGFIEIGSNDFGIASNNLIAYNKIINCGQTGTFHNKKNGFSVRIDQLKFYNNVIIETKIQFNKIRTLFWYSDPTKIDMVIIKNNIIWLSTGENVVNSYQDTSQLIHTNNIYKIRNGSIGFTIDSTEKYFIEQEQIFNDTSGMTENWDLHLLPRSPAINAGLNLGFDKDYESNPIIDMPDAGIYEYQNKDSIIPLLITATIIDSIQCAGGFATISINATGGTEPYFGTGTYTLKAGTHKFLVSDAAGLSKTISILIKEPTAIAFTVNYTILTSLNTITNLQISATGGTPPYSYQLNNGTAQTSNTFTNLSAGNYTVTVKDVNGCSLTQNLSILVTSLTNNPDKKLSLRVYPNPTSTYFTVGSIKYRGSFVAMKLNVFNAFGQLVYATQGLSNSTYSFGGNFNPGNYVLVALIDGTVQAIKLIKL